MLRGKKKLAKLLYYVDFDRYEYKESTQSLTGDAYKHLPLGPVPDHYMDIVARLEKRGALQCRQIDGSNGYAPTEVFTRKKRLIYQCLVRMTCIFWIVPQPCTGV